MMHISSPRTLVAGALLGVTLLSPGLAQDGPAGPPPAPSPDIPMGQWVLLDRVEIVANTDCLTLRALDRKVNRDERMQGTDTREKYLELRTIVALQNVNELLKRQAGEDLGFDEALVRARVNDMWEQQVTKDGGVTRATQKLTENSETVIEKRDELENDIYSSSWTWSVLGRDAGPGGRPVFDRFSRPGQLRQRYNRMKLTGLDVVQALGKVGATPAQYELEVLLLSAQAMGGAEKARDKAIEIRQALHLDAVDWEDALTTFGALGTPLQKPDRETLVRVFDPGTGALATFVDEAEEGSYSPVMVFSPMDPQGQRRPDGFAIYRLMARTPAIVPDFKEPGVQKHLQRYIQIQQDNRRYETGLQELRNRAYVWYPGIEQEQAQAEEALEARKQEVLEAREQNAAEQGDEAPEEPKPAPQEGVEGAQDSQASDPGEGEGR